MRLLAIRGRDLASLAGPFDVDLQAGLLGGSGIFAITGPTGAGKSTLLDAICLALFDAAPRLSGTEKAATANADGVKGDDPRSLLRHGAAAASAEVDFLGQDRKTYRATWQLRRAHGRPDGKLQESTVSLLDLGADTRIGGKKTETLAEIRRRIGLDFDQFRRAVLLAQGDFEAFIKAKSAERAALLERITGSDIYSRVSMEAFQRRKRHRAARETIEARLAEEIPLGPEDRAAATAALSTARSAVAALAAEGQDLRRAREWHERDAALHRHASEAECLVMEAEREDRAADSRRCGLALARRALGLRAELTAARDAARRSTDIRAGLANAEVAAAQAADGHASAALGVATAEQRVLAARETLEAAQPILFRARELEGELSLAAALAAQQELEEREAAQAHQDQYERAAELERESSAAERDRAGHEAWLLANAAIGTMALRMNEVCNDLADRSACAAQAAEAAADQERHLNELVTAEADCVPAARDLERISGMLAAADAETARLQAARTGFDRNAVQHSRDCAGQVAERAESALRAAEELAQFAADVGIAQRDAAEELARASDCRAAEASAKRDAEAFRARLDEAGGTLEWLETAAGDAAAHLRAGLMPGEPCPVCGALEHSVAADTVLRERLVGQRRHVAELRTGLDEAIEAQATAGAAGQAAANAAHKAEASIAKLYQGMAAAESLWLAARGELATMQHLLPELADPASAQALADASRQELTQAESALRADDALRARIDEAVAGREALRATAISARTILDGSQARARAARDGCVAAEHRRSHSMATAQAIERRLQGVIGDVLPNWQSVDDADAQCRALAQEWGDRGAARDRASESAASLAGSAAAAAVLLKQLAQASTHAKGRATMARDAAAALRRDRAGLLGGRATDDVQAEHDREGELAQEAVNTARAAQAAAAARLAAAAAALDAATTADVRAGKDAAAAEDALRESLHRAGLTRAEAEAACAQGVDWADAEAADLARLGEAASAARHRAQERRDALLRHRAETQPALDQAAVENRWPALEVDAARAEQARVEAEARILADDEVLRRRTSLNAALAEAVREGAVWEQLSALIGSADGDRFRRFAQSLTLDQLVQLANGHLRDLHPRYRLERAPGGEMHLQVVDTHMANEARSLANLSGGERFLTSLALALGLSSLQSREGLRIESLFIDEGFGTLDSSSLGAAISALEALQATGRQVGVISHIAEVQERIAARIAVVPMGGGRSRVEVRVGG